MIHRSVTRLCLATSLCATRGKSDSKKHRQANARTRVKLGSLAVDMGASLSTTRETHNKRARNYARGGRRRDEGKAWAKANRSDQHQERQPQRLPAAAAAPY